MQEVENNAIKISRKLSLVNRFQTRYKIQPQNVAEHSFRVAVLVDVVMEEMGFNTKARLVGLQKALYHDLEEAIMGDMPGPIKKAYGPLNKAYKALASAYMCVLSHPHIGRLWLHSKAGKIGDIVDMCDELECFQTIFDEILLGNSHLGDTFGAIKASFYPKYKDLIEKSPTIKQIVMDLGGYGGEINTAALR